MGIPQELIPHLFQPFYLLDSSATRRHGGSGLGLAISKKLVCLKEPGLHLLFTLAARRHPCGKKNRLEEIYINPLLFWGLIHDACSLIGIKYGDCFIPELSIMDLIEGRVERQ